MWLSATTVLLLALVLHLFLKDLAEKNLQQQLNETHKKLLTLAEIREAAADAERALTAVLESPADDKIAFLVLQIGDLQRSTESLEQEHPLYKIPQLLPAYAYQLNTLRRGTLSTELQEITVSLWKQLNTFSTQIAEEEKTLQTQSGTIQKDARRKSTLWILLAGIAISGVIIFAGSRKLARLQQIELQTMCDGTKALSNGNLDYRFKDITPDEMGQLKFDFNAMARQLQKQAEELKNANRELRKQASNLQEAHRHKDRFLSNMSHELRTPLNSIIGFSELLEARSGKLPPEKQTAYAKRILTAAEHLLDLITALLDLAKSGAGKLVPAPVELDLSRTITEMCDILSPLAERKKLEVRQEIAPGLQITADARMVRQIFINLFSNAVKYTDKGSVTVRLKAQDAAFLLEIADTGIGIPEKDQPKLFQDFYRVESADINAVEGVGIGLALSRRLAALNHAEITFTSKEGAGSTFTVIFKQST